METNKNIDPRKLCDFLKTKFPDMGFTYSASFDCITDLSETLTIYNDLSISNADEVCDFNTMVNIAKVVFEIKLYLGHVVPNILEKNKFNKGDRVKFGNFTSKQIANHIFGSDTEIYEYEIKKLSGEFEFVEYLFVENLFEEYPTYEGRGYDCSIKKIGSSALNDLFCVDSAYLVKV